MMMVMMMMVRMMMMIRTKWRSSRDGNPTSTRSQASPPYSRYTLHHVHIDDGDGDDGNADNDG